MVYKCCVTNCNSNTNSGTKKPTATFPEFLRNPDVELSKEWERFVNRKDWAPTKFTRICLDHFDDQYIKDNGTTRVLSMKLRPVPTIHTDTVTPPSLLTTVIQPRLPPRERISIDKTPIPNNINAVDVKVLSDFRAEHCPDGFQFSARENCVVYYRLVFNDDGVPQVKESVKINENLNVALTYEGIHIPLPQWLRSARNAQIRRTNSLSGLVDHIAERVAAFPPSDVLNEIRSISFYKPNGRPPYSSATIRYALLLRYTSRQAYVLLLTQFPLPSISLLAKLAQGSIDALKVAKVMLQEGKISADCILIFDEMYLQKGTQYQGGKLLGADELGRLFKGIVCFMIVSLKKSVPLMVKATPECTLSGK